MYKASEKVSQAGLYRCTTCGVLIPVNAGESLPACPSQCPDGIWTFFNEKWHPPPGETREAGESFAALNLAGERHQIPAGALLTDVGLGPEAAGQPHGEPKLAAFHYDGQVYFSSAVDLFQKTRVVSP